MARYLATSIPLRSTLIPSRDDHEPPAHHRLLDEDDRQRLRSYRPPSGLAGDDAGDTRATVRWTAEQRDALLALVRADVDIEPATFVSDPMLASTVPPPTRRTNVQRFAIRRGSQEAQMIGVRRR